MLNQKYKLKLKNFGFFIVILIFALCTLNLFIWPPNGQAAPTPTDTTVTGLVSNVNKAFGANNPFKYDDLGCLVANGITWALVAASLAMLGYLILGGVTWITSAGEKNKLESARDKITAALVGIVIVIASWAIFIILQFALGLPVGLTNNKCKIDYGSAGGGGGTGGGTQKPTWSCGQYPCDCCKSLGSDKEIKCCQQVGNLTSCVWGRNKNNSNACSSDFYIDWNCWQENYTNLVNQGKLVPATDACR